MNMVSKIATAAVTFGFVALLSLPMAGATGGDGTGPAPGTPRQLQGQDGTPGPCYGPGQGRGACGKRFRACNGPGSRGGYHHGYGPSAGRGGFVDKDGDGICDYHPDNGKAAEPVS